MGKVSQRWHYLTYFSFFTAFEPALLVMRPGGAWAFWYESPAGGCLGGLGYDGILLGLAALFYGGAALIFCRRDLPAPL